VVVTGGRYRMKQKNEVNQVILFLKYNWAEDDMKYFLPPFNLSSNTCKVDVKFDAIAP